MHFLDNVLSSNLVSDWLHDSKNIAVFSPFSVDFITALVFLFGIRRVSVTYDLFECYICPEILLVTSLVCLSLV